MFFLFLGYIKLDIRSLWRKFLFEKIVFVSAMLVSGVALADWTNGQAASYALGASDLSHVGSGAPSASRFSDPSGVCSDPVSGKVFVVLRNENRVLRFDAQSGTSTNGVAEAVFGQPNFTSTTANNGGLSASSLSSPLDCVVDRSGSLYVTDRANSRVLRYDNASAKSSFAAADGVLGQPNFTSTTTGLTASTFSSSGAYYLTLTTSGSLFVSDGRVLRFDNPGSKPNGAAADGVLGAANFTSAPFSGLTANALNGGVLLTVDSSGHLYLADNTYSRVLRFNFAATKPDGAAADGVLGASSLVSSGSGLFGTISGLSTSPDGYLYVSDVSKNRVLVFGNAANKANGAGADYVLGQPDMVSTSSAVTATGLNGPFRLAFNTYSSYLMVADAGNARIVGYYYPTSAPSQQPVTTKPEAPLPSAAGMQEQSSYIVPDGALPANAVTVNVFGTLKNATITATLDLNRVLGNAFAAGYNVYVVASVPPARVGAISASPVWFMMPVTNNWLPLTMPMSAFLENVASSRVDEQRIITVVANTDLSRYWGTEFYVGYGLSTEEMLASKRYRGLYRVLAPN